MMLWQSFKWITLIIYQQGMIIVKQEQKPEFILIYHSDKRYNSCEYQKYTPGLGKGYAKCPLKMQWHFKAGYSWL